MRVRVHVRVHVHVFALMCFSIIIQLKVVFKQTDTLFL